MGDIETENKPDQEMVIKRGEKGQFTKGYSGGPGRGYKKKEPDKLEGLDFWEATEAMIRQNMNSDVDSVKNQAINTYLKWKVMKDEYDEKSKGRGDGVYSPEVLMLLAARDLIPQFGGIDEMRRMVKDCPGCEKFRGKASVFNFPQQTQKGEAK